MDAAKLSANKLALLEKYRQGQVRQEKKAARTIKKRQEGEIAPLSYGQQQMWLLAQLIPDVPVYNESVTVRLPGALDVTALEQSLNEVIKRHEVWRSTFPFIDGQPVQVVHPALRVEVPFLDLRHLPPAEREPRAVQIATERALPLFDFTRLPLLRATLIRLDDEDHRLYLTLHHILFDGVIYEVFLPELYAHYQAITTDQPATLPELPVQYSDFALWQRERLQSSELADQLSYWKKQLANAPVALELPTDHPYPEVKSHRGARLPFSLSVELVEALRMLSRQESSTLYQILVASFNVLLYRYTGQTDLLIGTTTGGNRPQETQHLLGVFLNPLVLRTDLTGNPTLRELLRRVREVVLEAHAHQDIPFEQIVSELQPERNLRQSPFIQVMLSLEPPLPVLSSGWTITQADVEPKTAKFDLFLELDDRRDGFAAWLEYNSDIFEEETAWQIIRHWQMLLQSIVADPSQSIADLPILTAEEQQQLLVEWNQTAQDYPLEVCLQQLFEAQVERSPNAVAALYGQQQLTYQKLNTKADQLARYLQRQGVGPESLVGISIERSLDMLVAVLGVLKAGGAYVPLDPAYPRERLAYMLQNSQAVLLLTQQAFVEQLPDERPPILCLDSDWSTIVQEGAQELGREVTASNLAYVIYTSGSTGHPKGVQITHRAVVNVMLAMQQSLTVTRKDTFLGITTLSFDIAVAEIFLPLISGAHLVIESRETVLDGTLLLKEVKVVRPTILQATPATWRMLLDAGLTTLQNTRIISTGEALDQELRDELLACKPSVFWNLYGPTETTIWATADKITAAAPLSIGRPIANTQAYILDEFRHLVPRGVAGELYIGGVDLARGYLDLAELTEERFVSNPFRTDPQSRLYRTGDLVRYLKDGTIEYLGRLDHQIKLRGYRIELGEIEAVLRQAAEVHEVVVVAREDVPGDKRLVAYVTAAPGKTIVIDELVQRLKEHLPAYMLPAAFVQLDVLPVSPSGKVDRPALPAPAASSVVDEAAFVPPSSVAQDSLQQIWEELLNKKPIGMRDNFFLLGGHSLLAARLIARIERACGKRISLTTLFANPTIEQLSEALKKQEDVAEAALIVEVQSGVKTHTPIFFLHGDPSGGSFYCFKLARSLGKEQPFYACAPYHFTEGELMPSFEEMSATHLKAMRAIQPEGPYRIGGFCNGGLVAYEIARQLQAEDQQVELLFLVDPSPFAQRQVVKAAATQALERLRVSQAQQLDIVLRLRYIYRYLRFPIDRQRFRAQRGRAGKFPQLHALVPPAVGELRKDWFELYRWVAADYVPATSYTGKVTFVWTEGAETQAIWGPTPEVKNGINHFLRGGHVDWVRNHLDVLSRVFNGRIAGDTKNERRHNIEKNSTEGPAFIDYS